MQSHCEAAWLCCTAAKLDEALETCVLGGTQLSMAQANDEVWQLARHATEAAGHSSANGGGAAENGSRDRVEPYDRLGTPSLPMGQLKALHISSPVDNPLPDVRTCPYDLVLSSVT